MTHYTITAEQVAEVKVWADDIRNNRQADLDVNKGDDGEHRFTQKLLGKLGEIAVAQAFGGIPDFDPWTEENAAERSREPDLRLDDGYSFEVKTWCPMIVPDESWLIKKSDRRVNFPTQRTAFIFCAATPQDDGSWNVEIRYAVKATAMKSVLKVPQSPARRVENDAIYATDLAAKIAAGEFGFSGLGQAAIAADKVAEAGAFSLSLGEKMQREREQNPVSFD